MRRLWLGVGAISICVVGVFEFTACDASFDICEGSECPNIGDGGEQDGPNVPPGCDLTKDPKDSVACVDESIGVFVSANGSDSNAGTKGSPLKSITSALAKIDNQHIRVYVCDGTYGEGVKLTKPVGIYGGFSCADWSYDKTLGKVGPTGAGYALDIENLSGVTIEDLEFDAQNGVNPGDSSIAVFVASSTVTMKRVKAVAGNGVAGADAVATFNYAQDAGTAPTGINATTPVDDTGGGACVNHCINGLTSTGGGGGTGATTPSTPSGGADGGPAIPPEPLPADNGLGGTFTGSCAAGTGSPGATAAAADGGADGAAVGGHLSQIGWTKLLGAAGTTALAGQGGGGGAGGQHTSGLFVGGGGGGGCGGCGGAGGAGGSSGGSSFGILVFQGTLTFDTCIVQVGNGGDGKQGGSGQGGQTGGIAGGAIPLGSGGTGCNGGGGGKGGDGAGGGGGAGGNSIAIGYVGTKPDTTGVTMGEGAAGAAGGGGAGAAGNDGLPGAAGIAKDIMELP